MVVVQESNTISSRLRRDKIFEAKIRASPPDLARSKIPIAMLSEREGRLYGGKRMFVPEDDALRLRLLQSHHDNVAAGHPGRAKTYELLTRNYYWPRMNQTVRRYVRNCHTCTRSKASRLPYQGLLQPLDPPMRRWEDIAVDFIVELPRSKSETTGQVCRNIMVVTDRLHSPCLTSGKSTEGKVNKDDSELQGLEGRRSKVTAELRQATNSGSGKRAAIKQVLEQWDVKENFTERIERSR